MTKVRLFSLLLSAVAAVASAQKPAVLLSFPMVSVVPAFAFSAAAASW